MRKQDKLDNEHWVFKDYKQRMPTNSWRKLLLSGDDNVCFNGRIVRLVAKNLGHGIVEVSKAEGK